MQMHRDSVRPGAMRLVAGDRHVGEAILAGSPFFMFLLFMPALERRSGPLLVR